MTNHSVKPAEIAQFNALAGQWWDATGPMRALHMMNPVRAGWILRRISKHFGGTNVSLLDVGCGAGLLSEALAKSGCNVLGLDAAGEAITAAEQHAHGQGLPLKYRAGAAEELVQEETRFQVITALEVIEHVQSSGAFVATLASLLAPGGLLFISTINRTPQSFVVAKLGAEYLLRMLPIGTHNWRHFVTPVELTSQCRTAGLYFADKAGMSFTPFTLNFRISRDLSVNYIAMAEKKG